MMSMDLFLTSEETKYYCGVFQISGYVAPAGQRGEGN